jgi:hypothetical protein
MFLSRNTYELGNWHWLFWKTSIATQSTHVLCSHLQSTYAYPCHNLKVVTWILVIDLSEWEFFFRVIYGRSPSLMWKQKTVLTEQDLIADPYSMIRIQDRTTLPGKFSKKNTGGKGHRKKHSPGTCQLEQTTTSCCHFHQMTPAIAQLRGLPLSKQ